jgi:hypothetical protein
MMGKEYGRKEGRDKVTKYGGKEDKGVRDKEETIP